jgi:hypothetical protein
MKSRIEIVIYIGGIVLLGVFYMPLKTVFGDGPWAMLGLLAYILALRGIGVLVRRAVERRAAERPRRGA